jgi:hypothetical protein
MSIQFSKEEEVQMAQSSKHPAHEHHHLAAAHHHAAAHHRHRPSITTRSASTKMPSNTQLRLTSIADSLTNMHTQSHK